MLDKITEKTAQSLWRKIGEEALTKAVSTFATEGVKALIDVWKSKHMEAWKADFKDQKARREDAADKDDQDSSSTSPKEGPSETPPSNPSKDSFFTSNRQV